MPLSAADHALRKTGIAATDATAVVGVNPWRTPLDVYAEKVTDEPPPEPAGESAKRMALGHALEEPIMRLLAEDRGLTLAPVATQRHPIIPWALATPDRFVLDSKGKPFAVAEAKLVGPRMVRDWENGVPEYVHVQVQWQLTVTRTKLAYVAALLEGTDFRIFEIEHDADLEAAALEVCQAFWETHVLPRVAPPIEARESARESLLRLYPRVARKTLAIADTDAERAAREYLEARSARDDADRRLLEAELFLKSRIGDAEGIVGAGWRATWQERRGNVSWKNAVEALLPQKDPAVLEQFRGAPTRAFSVKESSR